MTARYTREAMPDIELTQSLGLRKELLRYKNPSDKAGEMSSSDSFLGNRLPLSLCLRLHVPNPIGGDW